MNITIEPTGGLCDRLSTIEFFLNYQKIYALTTIHIIWNLNDELNCSFESLFLNIPNIKVVNVKHSIFQKHKYLRKAKNFVLKLSRGNKYNLYQMKRENIFEIIQKKKNCWFIGLIFDEVREKMYFDYFKPIPSIQKMLIIDKSNENYIGIHIRRTDNTIAIQNSPTELFYKAIDNEIALNPNALFYCATDSVNELNELVQKYGSRIKYQTNCIRSRNTKEGIESALIDLLNLSNCTKIIGSDWSAFSGVAAKIGKIELERIIKK